MNSIPLTRYIQPPSVRNQERKRCSDVYAAVKRQQRRLEEQPLSILGANPAYVIASAHVQTGEVLRKYNLHVLAAEQLERAWRLLVTL